MNDKARNQNQAVSQNSVGEGDNSLIGSLWVTLNPNGTVKHITGVINGQRVFVNPNRKPKNDKSPSHFVFLAKSDDIPF